MNRRKFLEGTVARASALALSFPRSAWGNSLIASPARAGGAQTILKMVRRIIAINGQAASVFELYQQNGKPGLALQAGDAFNVVLRNETDEPTIMLWHGLTPPNISDCRQSGVVVGFSGGNIGTHWMHAYTLQEQVLLAASLIVRSKDDLRHDEQEVVLMLHDFSFATPRGIVRQFEKRRRQTGWRNADGGHGNACRHAGRSQRYRIRRLCLVRQDQHVDTTADPPDAGGADTWPFGFWTGRTPVSSPER